MADDQPARRQAGAAVDPRRRREARRLPTTSDDPDPSVPAQRVVFGTSGHRGSSLDGAFNEDHIARDHAGDLPPSEARRRSTDRSSSASTRTRSRSRRSRPRSRCWPRTASRSWSTRATATRRRRSCRTRCSGTTAAGGAGSPTASSITPSHNPPRVRRLQVRPAARRSRRHARDPVDRGARERVPRRRPARRRADAVRPRPQRRRPRTRTSTATRTSPISRSVVDLDAIRASGVRIGVDPLGGASVAYWHAIARALRPRPRRS